MKFNTAKRKMLETPRHIVTETDRNIELAKANNACQYCLFPGAECKNYSNLEIVQNGSKVTCKNWCYYD